MAERARYLDDIFLIGYIFDIEWGRRGSDTRTSLSCGGSLTEAEQEDVSAVAELLEAKGPQLPFPYDEHIKELKKEGFLDH